MRSLSIFGIILLAAVGTNAMSMEKTHNTQQKFLRTDDATQVREVIKTGKVYLAGEMKFTLQVLTLSASVSLKLGIEIEGEINDEGHTVLLKGFFSAGIECAASCVGSTKLSFSAVVEVNIPVPVEVGGGCPYGKAAYVIAYLLEDYAERVKNAQDPNSWYATAANFAGQIASWGVSEEVQKELQSRGCDKFSVTASTETRAKVKLGQANKQSVQFMLGNSAERRGKMVNQKCVITDLTEITTYAVSIKPVDWCKLTFEVKTQAAKKEIKVKFAVRVKAKKTYGDTDLKQAHENKEFIGGFMGPLEDKFKGVFESFGANKPSGPDIKVPEYFGPVRKLFEGVNDFIAQVPTGEGFMPDLAQSLNAKHLDIGEAFEQMKQSVAVSVENKARIGIDVSCTYDSTASISCKVSFVNSMQKAFPCSAGLPFGLTSVQFKGVMGEESYLKFQYVKV